MISLLSDSLPLSDGQGKNDIRLKEEEAHQDTHPLPRPPPPSKSFYNAEHNYSYSPSDAFTQRRTRLQSRLNSFFARHPRIERHRRLFAAFIYFLLTTILVLIILVAVLCSRGSNKNSGDDDGDGRRGPGAGGGGGGGYGDGPTTPDSELAKHNQGIPRPPINHSNATSWNSHGQGDATFYDPSVKNSVGQFSEGACGFAFINSPHDLVVALNKPDFGDFADVSRSPACGQCLHVKGPNGTVQVQVVDMCPECASGSVDLTSSAFAVLAPLDKAFQPFILSSFPRFSLHLDMAPIHRLTDKVKVVLTGFEPFGKHVTNPSWLAVKPLHNTTIELPSSTKVDPRHHQAVKVDIICQELPVEYRKVPDLVPALHIEHGESTEGDDDQKEYAKTYYIHVGVGRDGHTAIETQAHRTGYFAPDNAEWSPESKEQPPVHKSVWATDPDVLTTTVDTAALADYLTAEKGWICRQSLDAGHYLCEYTFYLSMAERHRRITAGQETEDDRTCLFVHLPSVGNPYSLEELQRFTQDMVVAVVTKY
ncbi:hypothetical protein BGZ83_006143 [Gryganskiella cystojenkinii]|nr:hypothetical protein BGZ83_006143 [Gryganskiella cystojenkinii]